MGAKRNRGSKPGKSFEQAVTRIQKMFDPGAAITRNEVLIDRLGNRCECDIVIRGSLSGHHILGIIECRDRSRVAGRDEIGAFKTKVDNLCANLRVFVSKKGFTKAALRLGQHEGIACLTLLPQTAQELHRGLGDLAFAHVTEWANIAMHVKFADKVSGGRSGQITGMIWQNKLVIDWFIREFRSAFNDPKAAGQYAVRLTLDEPIQFDGDVSRPVKIITVAAVRSISTKFRWLPWRGDGLYDWNSRQLKLPPGGRIFMLFTPSEIQRWDVFDGKLPDPTIAQVKLDIVVPWDTVGNVPALSGMGMVEYFTPDLGWHRPTESSTRGGSQ